MDEPRRSAGWPHLSDESDELPAGDKGGGSPFGERWSLPAAPLAHVLSTLRADDYMADGDVGTFARGLGLDPDLTRSVLVGDRAEMSGDEVVSVCGALRCSPYDIWGSDLGRQSMYVPEPERWLRRVETLDDGSGGREDLDFVRRRLDQLAEDMVSVVDTNPGPSSAGEPVRLEITRYRQGDVLTIDSTGHRHRVPDPDQPVQPGADYHFTFRRLGETEVVTAPLTATTFAQGTPPGHDVEPRLASLADALDE